jgi:hypothetical protein
MSTPLARRIAPDSTAAQVAAACGVLWLELEAALSPIIGRGGVSALGQRSLHLASAAHPWLAEHRQGSSAMPDSAWLVALLAQRSRDEAAAAGSAFLQTFRELLSNLIGASLTERLLRGVWGSPDISMNSPTAQDPTP